MNYNLTEDEHKQFFPEDNSEKCNCKFCREYRFIENLKKSHKEQTLREDCIDQLFELLDYFSQQYWQTSDDASYYKYKSNNLQSQLELTSDQSNSAK